MTPLVLVAVPAVAAVVLTARPMRGPSAWVLVAASLVGAILACAFAFTEGTHRAVLGAPYIVVDATARLFLVLINVIFLGIAAYVWNRLRTTPDLRDDAARFARFALLFMAAGDLVIIANHILAMWIALEATTIAAAPLIIRSGVPSSRRASWRYFVFSSVGLGVALLGFMCLRRSLELDGHEPTLFLDELAPLVGGPPNVWRKIGLALVFLGYGTKLGLAPMYSWLPETYDEAPPAVTAMLAAIQFNCALVGLLRVLQVYRAENRGLVANELVVIGLASMAVSTVSIIATHNLKRLIAYASINHAGVIAIGLGVGKTAAYGVLLYVVSNAFIKAILFLTAGKIKAHYQTKDTREIAGLIKDLPYSGVFLMVGTFALLGFPPFGSFLGELLILSGLVSSRQVTVFAAFCGLITITFVATGRTVFPMIWGKPKAAVAWPRQTMASASPKLAFLAALIAMGIYMPPVVNTLFRQVAATLGGE
jgi:hydrogenase-4 component F